MTPPAPDRKVSLRQLGGLSGFFRNPGLILHTLFSGAHVGKDAAGNHYFESRKPKGTRPRRWVVFNGAVDASAIGPEWHAWLHYITDHPLPADGKRPWQKPHEKNLTGTPAGYRPAGHDYAGGQRARTPADYEAWTPDI